MSDRGHWGSRFGFIMAAAGSAVGLGNVWRFPYITGENGGSAFILIYLAIVIGFGVPLAMAELVIGRTAQRNPVGAFRALGGKGWPAVGYLGVLTGFVILSFYVVVAGWTLAYVVFILNGSLDTTSADALGATFNGFVGSTAAPLISALVFAALTAAIVLGGIGKGIERANRYLMPALFVILLLLVIRSVTLPGAQAGIDFILRPDFSKVSSQTFIDALSQAFFSLSIGMGTLLTYGSYLSREDRLPSSTLYIVGIDSGVALLSAFLVLPAVFAAQLSPGQGPGLTFITLPAVFAQMPAGHLFGALFFILLAIAALTSAVSILEPTVAYLIDEHRLPRKAVVITTTALCALLAVPASLSFGAWSDVHFLGRTWFDLMDFLANSVLLPIGGLFTALFVGWAWAKPAAHHLSNEGKLKYAWTPLWLFVLRFVAPAAILWIFYALAIAPLR